MKIFWLKKALGNEEGKRFEVKKVNDRFSIIKVGDFEVPILNGIAIFNSTSIDELLNYDNKNDSKNVHHAWVYKHRLFRKQPPPLGLKLSKTIAKEHKNIVFLNVGITGGLFPWVIALNREIEIMLINHNIASLIQWRTFLEKNKLLEHASMAVIEAYNLPFKDDSIEALSVSYQEFISINKEREIKEIVRVLSRGGKLYLMDLVYKNKSNNKSNEFEKIKSLGIIEIGKLLKILEKHNLKVESVKETNEFIETDKLFNLVKEYLELDIEPIKVGIIATKL